MEVIERKDAEHTLKNLKDKKKNVEALGSSKVESLDTGWTWEILQLVGKWLWKTTFYDEKLVSKFKKFVTFLLFLGLRTGTWRMKGNGHFQDWKWN